MAEGRNLKADAQGPEVDLEDRKGETRKKPLKDLRGEALKEPLKDLRGKLSRSL